MKLSLTLDRVRELARAHRLIPLCLDVVADLETPVTAYLKVARGRYSFLLESVEGGERRARYSFIGTEPRAIIERRDEADRFLAFRYEVVNGEKSGNGVAIDPDVLPLLRRDVLGASAWVDPALPSFVGGAIGYLGYETVRLWEPRVPHTPGEAVDMPGAVLLETDTVLAFDHYAHRIRIVTHVRVDDHATIDDAYAAAAARLTDLASRLRDPLPSDLTIPATHEAGVLESNVARKTHEDGVAAIKDMIREGDAIQVVLSQRFARPTAARPFDIYRALRTVSPTPYMYCLHLDDLDIVGASVETLVRVTGRDVYYHPIAGTRRRGRDDEEDLALEAELRMDEKERAEHLMLVDLGRNDVGRVAATGTVRVTDLMTVERYSNVMHLVSTVEGLLEDGLDALDALRVCFPAGTVSGAPKVKAMEILAGLEKGARRIYAGAVGYVTYGGDLDTCIAIRTAAIVDGVAYVQAGGGLVSDSVPSDEYMETVHKASALQRAIDLAEAGLEGPPPPISPVTAAFLERHAEQEVGASASLPHDKEAGALAPLYDEAERVGTLR